ncbi:MAG TPA: DUF4394 domain-containing protein [Gemmatimonadales bacterium]|jgi:hypothetical protein
MSSPTILRPLFRGLVLAAVALVAACGGDSGGPSSPNTPDPIPSPTPEPAPQPAPGPVSGLEGRAIFGLTCSNQLVLFGSGNPEVLQRQVQITGMSAGSVMAGIDFRGGELYGVGSDSRVYTVDTLTGAATAVGGAFAPALVGEHFGMAYDAAHDLLHVASVESNQSLEVNPTTGMMATARPDLAFAAGDAHEGANPAIAAEGYHGSVLYGIEANENTLVMVSPETGALTTIADLSFNVYLCAGLDIDTDGTAYAALSTDSGSELYTIDLTSGAATWLGDVEGSPILSVALRP